MTAIHGGSIALHSIIAGAIRTSSELLIYDTHFEGSYVSTDAQKEENDLYSRYYGGKKKHAVILKIEFNKKKRIVQFHCFNLPKVTQKLQKVFVNEGTCSTSRRYLHIASLSNFLFYFQASGH